VSYVINQNLTVMLCCNCTPLLYRLFCWSTWINWFTVFNIYLLKILDMSKSELEHLLRHLGHDSKTHIEFYHLSHSTVQLSKVSKSYNLISGVETFWNMGDTIWRTDQCTAEGRAGEWCGSGVLPPTQFFYSSCSYVHFEV